MKKILAALVALLSFSVYSFSFAEKPVTDETHCQESIMAQGRGACTHPGCRCQSFNQRPGYYQCMCGHQRFSHK